MVVLLIFKRNVSSTIMGWGVKLSLKHALKVFLCTHGFNLARVWSEVVLSLAGTGVEQGLWVVFK
jgi:hypothetical protein